MPTSTIIAAICVALTLCCAGWAQQDAEEVVVAINPDPQKLPQLSIHQVAWSTDRVLTMIRVEAPAIPDFVSDIWCYESAFDLGQGEAGPDGSVVLRQKTTVAEYYPVVTRAIPEPGAVRFEVTARVPDAAGARQLPGLNSCWQLRRAKGFTSEGSPYPEFVARCFLFTDNGFTTMDRTERFPDTRRPADDPVNSPPWVQVYVPVWQAHPGQPKAFWGYSTDRYLYPLLGCLSKDGKYLAAMGGGRNQMMSEGWHDCLHLSPSWGAYDPETGTVTCCFKLYLMENDPATLLERFASDFPEAMRLQEGRVPPQ